MIIRFVTSCLLLVLFCTLANSIRASVTYYDADCLLNKLSVKAMKMRLLTAFDEVQGFIKKYDKIFHKLNKQTKVAYEASIFEYFYMESIDKNNQIEVTTN